MFAAKLASKALTEKPFWPFRLIQMYCVYAMLASVANAVRAVQAIIIPYLQNHDQECLVSTIIFPFLIDSILHGRLQTSAVKAHCCSLLFPTRFQLSEESKTSNNIMPAGERQ